MSAYRLLKVANLLTRGEQLVKATITELKSNSVKSKLIKIFSDNSEVPTSEFNDIHIKTAPVCQTTQKMTLFIKLIMKMKTLNSNMNMFMKMTTNNKINTILFMDITINIRSKQKATSHTNDHFNTETTSNLTTINKITSNKIINNQNINNHNH